MALRRGDPGRLLAAVNAQRAALGRPAWSGPVTVEALGAGCVGAVLAAIYAGGSPEPAALRCAVVPLLGVLPARAPAPAADARIPPPAPTPPLPAPSPPP